MESAANYNMRVLLVIVLVCATLADDSVHYPTNHPGVCNILAFVGDHVDEVVHVAHDEIEALEADKSSYNSSGLANVIEKVKRQVRDIEQVAQCLVTDVKKEDTAKNPQEIILATSEAPRQKTQPQEVQRSIRDVIHLLETYTTHKAQSENVENQQAIKVISEDNQAQTGDQPQQAADQPQQTADQPQQNSQHVARSPQDVKRLVRDVVHLLTNISTLAPQTDKEEKQKDTNVNTQLTAADVLQQSRQYVASGDQVLRQVRDVVHLLESIVQKPDAKQQISIKESNGNVVEHSKATLEQHVATQERHTRNAVKSIEEEILDVSKKHNIKSADNLQQDLIADSFQRFTRDVAHILGTQSLLPLQLENEVKQENNLQNLQPDYSQTADILPEETQYVAIQETVDYADQLFPPTIGQHADFQERLKRSTENIIEEEVSIPSKDTQHIESAENPTRFVRDVVHLLDSYTTLAPNPEKLKSIEQQTADVLLQSSQHVGKQQCKENVKENLAPTVQQSAAVELCNDKQRITSNIPQTASLPIQESCQQALHHVDIQETDANGKTPTVSQNRRKRNVEIGRKSPTYIMKHHHNDVLKKKSKRSPDELQLSLDQYPQPEQNFNKQAVTLKETPENKYIQIVKRRAAGGRTRRSEDKTLKDQTRTEMETPDFLHKLEDSLDLHVNDDSIIENVTPTRVARSIKTLEKFPAHYTVPTENSQLAVGSSDVPSSTPTQNPIDSQQDVREFLKPTVKVQHSGLPLTQFARRNTIKKTR